VLRRAFARSSRRPVDHRERSLARQWARSARGRQVPGERAKASEKSGSGGVPPEVLLGDAHQGLSWADGALDKAISRSRPGPWSRSRRPCRRSGSA